jgi:hypothetical protein
VSTTELQFTPGDATWHQWRKKALSDLYFFAGVICKYGDPVTMTEGMHKLMCRVVERKTGVPELDDNPYRLILMPRGTGKSTIIAQAYVLQRICQDPNTAILIANEKLDNAQAFLAAIKHQFEHNELFRALFPELIHPDTGKAKWNESEINVPRTSGRKEPTVRCQGAGAALASMHVDLIVGDDIISREAAENARRGDGQIVEAMHRWVSQLVPLLNPGYPPFPEIIFVGTRWFRGDNYEKLEEMFGYGEQRQTWSLGIKLPNGEIQSVPVHRRGDLVIFSRQVLENGRPTWPERPGYDIESLAKFRLRDPELFAANMMNNPSDEVTATFKESWLRRYTWTADRQVKFIDEEGKSRSYFVDDLDILIWVDPGGFGRRKGSDRSRGAIVVTGTTPGDAPKHLLLECFSDKVPYTAVMEKIVALATRYPPRRVFIENAGQQITFIDAVRRMAIERGVAFTIEEVTPKNEQKDARILELEPFFERGLILVGQGPQFHEFLEQYRHWPTPRADLLDVLAYGPRKWRQPVVQRTGHEARQRVEREQYLKRRGIGVALRH